MEAIHPPQEEPGGGAGEGGGSPFQGLVLFDAEKFPFSPGKVPESLNRPGESRILVPMPFPGNSLWTFILEQARRYVTWSLRKAGIPKPHADFLAEDALQEALLEVLQENTPADRPPREVEIKRAVWRTTARMIRRRKHREGILEETIPSPHAQPLEEAAWKELQKDLAGRLTREERELFQRILEGDVPFKSSGAIHRSALAEELGISRRSLGRRLERLGEKLGPPPPTRRSAPRENKKK